MGLRFSWVGVGLVLLAAGAQAGEVKLAIWRLKPLGLETPTAERLEVLLRAEASRLRGFSLQDAASTESILGKAENLALRECAGDSACLSEIGKALGVDKLITGVIGALGEDYTFDLKLVDAASSREERRINEALSGNEDMLIPSIRQALYKLVAPDQLVGSIRIEVAVSGAEVLVDENPAGMTPLARPIGGLKPGPHPLEIRKTRFKTFTSDVAVRFQQTTRVKVDLGTSVMTGLTYESEAPIPEPITPPVVVVKKKEMRGTRIAAWATLGAAAAAGLAGGILGWRSKEAQDEVNTALANHTIHGSASDNPYATTIQRGQSYALGANISFGIAGGAAVASLVLWIIELTRGAGDKTTAPEQPAGGSPGLFSVRWRF